MGCGHCDPKASIGQHVSSLPTPALVLSKQVMERNCARMIDKVTQKRWLWRPHVKTLKCIEATRMMLGSISTTVVVSTLREIEDLIPLAEEGVVDQILYSMPCPPGALARLTELAKIVDILLMVDNERQIEAAQRFMAGRGAASKRIGVFVKIDLNVPDGRRAGLPLGASHLKRLVENIRTSDALYLHGIYAHAGHSYRARDRGTANDGFEAELRATMAAALLLSDEERAKTPLVLSIGATPTANAVDAASPASSFTVPSNCTIELHAGCYVVNDLQQLSTGTISETDIAIRLLAEVCSVYEERNEALVNAGVLALSRETSHGFPGFGQVLDHPGWVVGRMSQEHGILTYAGGTQDPPQDVQHQLQVGQKIMLHVQHACITTAGHEYYFVVDEEDVVCDIWWPWKGW